MSPGVLARPHLLDPGESSVGSGVLFLFFSQSPFPRDAGLPGAATGAVLC